MISGEHYNRAVTLGAAKRRLWTARSAALRYVGLRAALLAAFARTPRRRQRWQGITSSARGDHRLALRPELA